MFRSYASDDYRRHAVDRWLEADARENNARFTELADRLSPVCQPVIELPKADSDTIRFWELQHKIFTFPGFEHQALTAEERAEYDNLKKALMETTQLAKNEAAAEVALYRQSTNIAGLCKDIVLKSAVDIQGRKYVRVEGWMSIATAHGCIATIKSVENTADGVVAVAEIRRQSDGQLLTTAEGFVGRDEPTWYGGEVTRWNKFKNEEVTQKMPKRADYAIRAMAQTRAISRACRTAFAHVVVLMDAGLETVPAEEMGVDDEPINVTGTATHAPAGASADPGSNPDLEEKPVTKETLAKGGWKFVVIHFGTNYKGKALGDLSSAQLKGWFNWQPKLFGTQKEFSKNDVILRMALDVAASETQG